LDDHRGANLTDDDSSDSDSENIPPNNRNRNYGKRVKGPWVFGMCWRHDGLLEKRFLLLNVEIELDLFQLLKKKYFQE